MSSALTKNQKYTLYALGAIVVLYFLYSQWSEIKGWFKKDGDEAPALPAPSGSGTSAPKPKPKTETPAPFPLAQGSVGSNVKIVQRYLNQIRDTLLSQVREKNGSGAAAVFKRQHPLISEDGDWGPKTQALYAFILEDDFNETISQAEYNDILKWLK